MASSTIQNRNDEEPSGSNSKEEQSSNPFPFLKKRTARPPPRNSAGHLLQHTRLRLNARETRLVRLSLQQFDKDIWTFTPAEDAVIRKNWKRFRKKFELDGHIFQYCESIDLADGGKWELKPVDPAWHLWPSLCHNLPNRYAETVRKRIFYIFDDNFEADEENYPLDEITERLTSGESLNSIAETLKVPLDFLKKIEKSKDFDKPKKRRIYRRPGERIKPEHHFLYLRYLFRCVKPTAVEFHACGFDWDAFRKICENRQKPCPTPGSIIKTYRKKFYRMDFQIFRFLEPIPSLKERMMIVYEALARYEARERREWNRMQEIRKGVFKAPLLRLKQMFEVVYEHYTKKDPNWQPPTRFAHYMDTLDVEKVEKRMEKAKSLQKREKQREEEAEPIKTPLRVKSTRLKERMNARPTVKRPLFQSVEREQEEEEMEISTILADNSLLTNIEISATDASSASFRADETILAGGGSGRTAGSIDLSGFESLQLPGVDEIARKRKELEIEAERKFSVDDSFVNIWDQINQN